MKRIAISVLIGIGCCLLMFVFLQFGESKLKYRSDKPLYTAELKIKIGDVADDRRSITTTLTQIKKRLDFSPDLYAKQIDTNSFLLTIKKVSDTAAMKKLVSESIELRFLETYLRSEIENSLTAVENQLSHKRKAINGLTDSTDKYAFMLENVDLEAKKKNGTCRLDQLITFYSGIQDVSGFVRYPAALGTVKTRDTIYLDKLLKEEEIKVILPADLALVYGPQDRYSKDRDSVLYIYAIKVTDPKFYPLPTGDNIQNCRVDLEPATGNPSIAFEFDLDGSNLWYTMTKRNTGRPVAILLNDLVLSAPVVEEAIPGGSSRVSGFFTFEEATYLTSMINTSRLALPVQLIESKFKPVRKSFIAPWMLGLIFLFSASMAYGISYLIKPASKL